MEPWLHFKLFVNIVSCHPHNAPMWQAYPPYCHIKDCCTKGSFHAQGHKAVNWCNWIWILFFLLKCILFYQMVLSCHLVSLFLSLLNTMKHSKVLNWNNLKKRKWTQWIVLTIIFNSITTQKSFIWEYHYLLHWFWFYHSDYLWTFSQHPRIPQTSKYVIFNRIKHMFVLFLW